MTSDQRAAAERVERLFHEAMARPPEEWDSFLAEACSGDEGLRRHVRLLLDQSVSSLKAEILNANPSPSLNGKDLVGRRLGSYSVVDRLGAGGMGEVYRARDSKLGRDVAIKVLPPAFTEDPERLARFDREARVLASLNHPNIAAIYGVEEGEGFRVLVLELVEGLTLSDRIERGALPIEEALPIARQIADALDAAHAQGVTHRDVKPSNIKVRPDGTVKVLDFGLAKVLSSALGADDLVNSPTIVHSATREGVILGTVSYMAPEQAKGAPVDRRADIWAFGCVLYEMLTGKRAFTGGHVSEILAAVLRAEPDWESLPPNTPASIRRLLRRAFIKNPRERLADTSAIRLEIADAMQGADQLVSAAAKSASGRAHRWRWAGWAVGAIGVAAAVLAIIVLSPGRAPVGPLVFFEIPVTTNPLGEISISPNGELIVYLSAAYDTKGGLSVRPLDSLRARFLPGTESGQRPFWSPDSRFLAFFSGGKLKKIKAAGGPVEELAPCCAGATNSFGSWNLDDVIIYGDGVLRSVSANGGETRQVTELDKALEQTEHAWPWFLPDGRHFLYFGRSKKIENEGIFIGSLDSKTGTLLMPSEANAIYANGIVLYSRQEKLMARPFDANQLAFTGEALPVLDGVLTSSGNRHTALSVSDQGTMIYREPPGQDAWWWLDRRGNRISVVANLQASGGVRLSPDDKSVAVARPRSAGRSGTDLWKYDVSQNANESPPTRLYAENIFNSLGVWSPDGSELIFLSDRDLYKVPVNGAGAASIPLKAEPGLGRVVPLDWSKDWIIFRRPTIAGGSLDLWILPQFGNDRLPRPYRRTPFAETQAALSPNGRWLAYVSNESGTNYQVIVQSFPDSSLGKKVVSVNGGNSPRWRADGKELYYLDREGMLIAVSVQTDDKFEVQNPTALFSVPDLSPSDTQTASAYSYDVADDGQRFLVIQREPAPRTIIAVLNWPLLLKR